MGIPFLKRLKSSIIKKLILSYMAIVLIPTVAGGLFIYNSMQENIWKDFSWLVENQLSQMERNITERVESCRQATNAIRWDNDLINVLQDDLQDQLLVDMLANNIVPKLESICMQNRNIYKLRVIHSNTNIERVADLLYYDKNISNGIWGSRLEEYKAAQLSAFDDMIIQHFHNENLFINRDNPGKRHVVSVYRPIYGYLNKMAGILEIDILDDLILEPLMHTDDAKYEVTSLVSIKGEVLYSSRQGFEGLTKDYLHSEDKFQSFALDGKQYYAAKRYVEALQSWIILYIPQSAMRSGDGYKAIFALAVIAGLITLCFLAYFLIRLILGKLTKLTQAMDSVKRGNLETALAVCGTDEVDRLALDFNAIVKRIRELIDNLKESGKSEKEAIYKALENQMNPHFLCNALDMVRVTAEKEKQPEIANIVGRLMNTVVYNISTKEKFISLKEELKNASDFVELHNLLKARKVEIHMHVDGEMNQRLEQYRILKFVLQPLVENAIKHGFGKKQGECCIFINARRNGEAVMLTIEDNGTGISEPRMREIKEYLNLNHKDYTLRTSGNGIGLRNIHERLVINHGTGYGLEIESCPGIGSCVTLTVPVIRGECHE